MRVLESLVFLLLLLLVITLGILVGIDNSAAISLAFLDWRSPAAPLFVWVSAGLILGFVLGLAVAGLRHLGQRRRNRQLERELETCRREVDSLRQIGAED